MSARRQPRGPDQRRGGAPAGEAGAARFADQPLVDVDRRRQRLHALQRDHRRLLRPHPVAGAVRGRALRADRDRQLGDRDPPGAEGEGDARPARAAGRAAGEGDPRRPAGRAARRGGRARRRRPGRARRPARRRRRGGLDPGLTIDESLLTGESDGIRKRAATVCSRARSASRAPATTSSTRCARTATPRSSPARRGSSATRPRRCSSRSTRC